MTQFSQNAAIMTTLFMVYFWSLVIAAAATFKLFDISDGEIGMPLLWVAMEYAISGYCVFQVCLRKKCRLLLAVLVTFAVYHFMRDSAEEKCNCFGATQFVDENWLVSSLLLSLGILGVSLLRLPNVRLKRSPRLNMAILVIGIVGFVLSSFLAREQHNTINIGMNLNELVNTDSIPMLSDGVLVCYREDCSHCRELIEQLLTTPSVTKDYVFLEISNSPQVPEFETQNLFWRSNPAVEIDSLPALYVISENVLVRELIDKDIGDSLTKL